jgi:hypothetical protein
MQLAGKMTMHQVHPAKIGTDVTASVVSNTLVRQGGRCRTGEYARILQGRRVR